MYITYHIKYRSKYLNVVIKSKVKALSIDSHRKKNVKHSYFIITVDIGIIKIHKSLFVVQLFKIDRTSYIIYVYFEVSGWTNLASLYLLNNFVLVHVNFQE